MSSVISLFIAYCDEDDALRQELTTHLAMLRRRDLIRDWDIHRIEAGGDRRRVAQEQLDRAKIVLLLISADFLSSDYCYNVEMTRALEKSTKESAWVLPIILRDCDWSHAPFAHLAVLPERGIPVASWENRDKAWKNVVDGVHAAICRIQSSADRRNILPVHGETATLSEPCESSSQMIPASRAVAASRLIRTRLPALLANAVGDPIAVLIRADVPTTLLIRTASYLDQWTYLCDWLARSGLSGFAYTLSIVDEAQSVAFSDDVSRWAVEFIFALLGENGPSPGNETGGGGGGGKQLDIRQALQTLITNEMLRWEKLRKIVEIRHLEGDLSEDALHYVCEVTAAWERMCNELNHLSRSGRYGRIDPSIHCPTPNRERTSFIPTLDDLADHSSPGRRLA
jgi:hypothetical protein